MTSSWGRPSGRVSKDRPSRQASAFSRRNMASEGCIVSSLPIVERAQGMPGARCTRGPVCPCAKQEPHTSIQVQRRQSGIPCAVALRLISRSPRGPGFLAPVVHVMRSIIADLTPASGRRDHATSPYANVTFVFQHARVHRIPASRFVTIREAPLLARRDRASHTPSRGSEKAKYFFERG